MDGFPEAVGQWRLQPEFSPRTAPVAGVVNGEFEPVNSLRLACGEI